MTKGRRARRFFGRALIAVLVAMGGIWALAPRAEVNRSVAAEAMAAAVADVPEVAVLEGWLAAREGQVPNLREGAEKRVIWAGAPGAVTPLSVVYLHGFSSSSEELRPVPDRVAAALGANLHFARLRGHGRDGSAMGEATAEAWLSDVAQAVEIGRRIGARVVVLATSTSGTLMALQAEANGAEGVAGLALISPNFEVNDPGAFLLEWPGARWWAPWLVGRERVVQPRQPGQADHWTLRYPFRAVFATAAVVRAARGIDYDSLRVPALFLTDPADRVVVAAASDAVAARWGGPVTRITYEMGLGDDPFAHIIAGDIMSPGQTDRAVADILGWIETLP